MYLLYILNYKNYIHVNTQFKYNLEKIYFKPILTVSKEWKYAVCLMLNVQWF